MTKPQERIDEMMKKFRNESPQFPDEFVKNVLTELSDTLHEELAKEVEEDFKVEHEKHKDDESWCKYCGINKTSCKFATLCRSKIIK